MDKINKYQTGVILVAVIAGLLLGHINFVADYSAKFIVPLLMVMLFGLFLTININELKSSFLNVKFSLTNMKEINTEYSEFGGTVMDKYFYFSSARNTARKNYTWNEEPFLDIYVAEIIGGTVKNENLIKGIHLEGLRKVGDPNELAKKYYDLGIDEIIFMDAVAAYYDRNSLSHIIEKACSDVFVPITVGGGIRSIENIQTALNSGADKVAINTQSVKDPSFIQHASKTFGSQCIVSSVDVMRIADGKWEVFIDNGREPTGLDVIEWVKKLESLGAGEIMLTSIDSEGTKKGFDLELNKAVGEAVFIPVIASGGAGTVSDITDLMAESNVDAVAVASLLHYDLATISDIKLGLSAQGIKVRM